MDRWKCASSFSSNHLRDDLILIWSKFSFVADKSYTTWDWATNPCNTFIQLPYKGVMPVNNRSPISADDDDHYDALMARQQKADKDYNTHKDYNCIPVGSTVVVQWEDRGL